MNGNSGNFTRIGRAALVALLCLAGAPSARAAFEVEAVLVENNATTTNVHFSVPFGAAYQAFPVYLRVTVPTNSYSMWGAMLYTDNRNPAQTGVTVTTQDGFYGGFFIYPARNLRLPVMWQVYNGIQNSGHGVAVTTPQSWAFIQDKSDAALQGRWDAYDVVRARTFAAFDGLAPYPPRAGVPAANPVYVYLAGDYTRAPSLASFTTVFNLDLYTYGEDVTAGGYATPNPFTPITGQRAHFNFHLRNLDATFRIKIFTVRGRLIRTISDVPEWDGRKENGDWAEGGLYLYQIEAEGKHVSGTVVLIK